MEINKETIKKRRRDNNNNNNSNPLARARRGSNDQRSRDTNNNTAAADDIWFRKLGLGYQCFIQYYQQQPIGTVYTYTDDDNNNNNNNTNETTEQQQQQQNEVLSSLLTTIQSTNNTIHNSGANNNKNWCSNNNSCHGLSRASKRRKKKKKQQQQQQQQASKTNTNTSQKGLSSATIVPSTTTTTSTVTVGQQQQQKRPSSVDWLLHSNNNNQLIKQHPLWNATIKKKQNLQHNVEFIKFIYYMSQPLPFTFRIRKYVKDLHLLETFHKQLQQQQIKQQEEQQKDDDDSDNTITLKPLYSLYIDETTNTTTDNCYYYDVYQSNNHKSKLTQSMKDFFMKYSQNGIVARQELGSMIPVTILYKTCKLLQQQQSNNNNNNNKKLYCLDLCASPGSKTMQLLEILLLNNNNKNKNNKNNFFLVANDILQSRLDALQQAIHRSGILLHNNNNTRDDIITYTCQDATKFDIGCANSNNIIQSMKFDIILCDVPCSGDGTIRKDSYTILKLWKPSIANQLHVTQVNILTRAIQLLKDDGSYVCYSTCSLNPIENEAVIATVLNKFIQDDNNIIIELIDIPEIPNLILRNGITNWKVADYNPSTLNNNNNNDDDDDDEQSYEGISNNLIWYDTYDDAIKHTPEKNWLKSLWPSQSSSSKSQNIMKMLTKCKRLHPQDNDSGGFFVALLRKKKRKEK